MDGRDEQAFSMHDLKEGSPWAFREFFFQHYSEFFSFACSLLGDQAAARRHTTGAFFLLWKKRVYFDNDKDGKAFLYNTIRNSCFNYLNYRQRNPGVKEYHPVVKMDDGFPEETLQELLSYVARVT